MKLNEVKKYGLAILYTFLMLFFVTGQVYAYDESQRDIAAGYYNRGADSYLSENYSQAIVYFKKSYEIIPYADTAYYLSAAYTKLSMPQQAGNFAKKSLSLKPPLRSELVDDAKAIITWANEVKSVLNKIPMEMQGKADIALPRPPKLDVPKSSPSKKDSMSLHEKKLAVKRVRLQNRDSYHFRQGVRGELTGGDFYFSVDDKGVARFFANNSGQRGLQDLGDIGKIPLSKVLIPKKGYYKFGVPVVSGHTYVSLAREGEVGYIIVFRVVSLRNNSVYLQYRYR